MKCGRQAIPDVETAFAALPDARFDILPDGGLLLCLSHAEAVVALFADLIARNTDRLDGFDPLRLS